MPLAELKRQAMLQSALSRRRNPRSKTLPTKRPGAKKRDIRSVSFNNAELPGAAPTAPDHRNASPARPALRAATSTDAEIQEPEQYSDEANCKQLHELRAEIVAFARGFEAVPEKLRGRHPLDALTGAVIHRELVAFASLLLMNGSGGLLSWLDDFENQVVLQGLVVGLVTRTLKEQVFDLLYFGATEADQERLDAWSEEAAELHGFERQRQARALLEDIDRHGDASEKSLSRHALQATLLTQLYKLVMPLYELGHKRKRIRGQHAASVLLPPLMSILTKAIACADDLRRSPDVAFEWTDVIKDWEFDPKLAECFNVGEMLETSPYARNGETGRAVLKPGREEHKQCLIAGIVSPGLVCYRLGKPAGMSEGEGQLIMSNARDYAGRRRYSRAPAEEAQGRGDACGGFTRRVLMKSVVLLRWGRQSLMTRHASTPGGYEAALVRGEEDKVVSLWDVFVQNHPDQK